MSTVLVLDDEEPIRGLLVRLLETHGHACATAARATEARRLLAEGDYDVLLCDVNLPGESGLELLRDLAAGQSETAIVMVTGVEDPSFAEVALELGAYGYIIKPFRQSEVLIAVANALRRRALELESRSHRELLERTVLERTSELRSAVRDLKRSQRQLRLSQEETIYRLAKAAEFHNVETGHHIERMSRYCALVAGRIGLDREHQELIRIASPLHDVGKIGMPDRILKKAGALRASERELIKQHTEIGYRILSGSGTELLELAATLALTHHERHDGGGYPRGLAGEEIPLPGRIAAVCDVFDALSTDRVYRRAFPVDEAVAMMVEGRGTQFEPAVLDLFLDSLHEVLAIKAEADRNGGLTEPDRSVRAHVFFTRRRAVVGPP